MKTRRYALVAWLGLLAWLGGWNAHAGMSAPQLAAGYSPVCGKNSGSEERPLHGAQGRCAVCVAFLAPASASADQTWTAAPGPAEASPAGLSRATPHSILRIARTPRGPPSA